MVADENRDSAIIGALLADAGETEPSRIQRLEGGGNNRVYRVAAGEHAYVAKLYHHDPSDGRERARTEWDFSTALWEWGVRTIPRPVVHRRTEHAALFGYVDGKPFAADGTVSGAQVGQALSFVEAINRHRSDARARRLPAASEACFSDAAHLATIRGRIGQLAAIHVASPADRAAAEFVASELSPRGADVLAKAGRRLAKLGVPDRELPTAHRCLSPSDFGFHNALLVSNGQIVFHDFEYAGWDDPAKLVCDFFTQPKIAVDRDHWDPFVSGVGELCGGEPSFAERCAALWPAFRVKWACIALNDFQAPAARRRAFSQGKHDVEERKQRQLATASRLLYAPE